MERKDRHGEKENLLETDTSLTLGLALQIKQSHFTIRKTNLSVDKWTLVATRLVKDMRIFIGKMIWGERFVI